MTNANTEINTTRTISSKQLKNALQYCIAAKLPAFIWGAPGIGKSSVVAEMCNEMGGKLFDIRLSQVEQTDLRGMPFFDYDSRTMQWAHPVDLPSHEEAKNYPFVFLFLDEMNAAAPSIMAAAYQLILDRKIGTYTLPDNCVVIAAGNREGDRGVTYKMPKPLSNRFVHFDMRVDFDSWNEWAIGSGIHPDVVGFLNFSKNSLNTFDPKSPENAYATPRSWEYVSKLLDANIDDSISMDIISGTIGNGLAISFDAHRKISSQLPNPTEILKGKIKTAEIKNFSAQYSLATTMLYELKEKHPTMKNEGKIAEWNSMADNFLEFMMENFETEITVASMRNGFQTMGIPFDNKNMPSFKKFFAGPGKLILKSFNI